VVHEGVLEVCHICGVGYPYLKAHMDMVHNEEANKTSICEICGKAVKNKSMTQHLWDHSKNLVCTLCSKYCVGKRKLADHLGKEHQVYCLDNDLFVCHKCHQKCHTTKELQTHLVKEHEMKNDIDCEQCELVFPVKSLLTMHLMDCHRVDPLKAVTLDSSKKIVKELNFNAYACDQCDKVFKSDRTLLGHKRQVHDKASHIKCEHCEYSTFETYRMKLHMLQKHMEATKYPCDKCSFVTNIPSILSKHKQFKHEKVRPYPCTECNRKFEVKMKMADHMLKAHNIVYQYFTPHVGVGRGHSV